jgi:IclR family pca regulon transcriptional regulator
LVSLGRVLLAALPADAREQFLATVELKRLTPKTITQPRTLKRELAATAERGYGWVDGELDPAICGIAVPVRDTAGNVLAALSVNTISGPIDEAGAKARYLVPLQRAAQEIRAHSVV